MKRRTAMKSKFLRILSLILIMSFVLSMFTIFASAETSDGTVDTEQGEEEDKPKISVLFNRHFAEGWDAKNGLNWYQNGKGSSVDIDYEITFDFEYNYFMRFNMNSTTNDYLQMSFGDYQEYALIVEFDLKADDNANFPTFYNMGTSGGSYTERTDYDIFGIYDRVVKFFPSADYSPEGGYDKDETVTLGNSWTTFKFIFDYTYEKNPILEGDSPSTQDKKKAENAHYFLLSIYYGPADGSEPLKLYMDKPLELYAEQGRGMNIMRWQTARGYEGNFGDSVCIDNMKAYTGSKEFVDITLDDPNDKNWNYGNKVSLTYPKNVDILSSSGLLKDPFVYSLSMKLGVDYYLMNDVKDAIATDENGNAYGAPQKIDGKVFVPIYPVLDYMQYPSYLHPDGKYLDISTGTGASYLVVGNRSATVNGKSVTLTAAPGYLSDENGNEILAVCLDDIHTLFPDYYADYDDMGFLMVTTVEDPLDRDLNCLGMVQLMKKFIYDFPTQESLYSDVQENTNNFTHPYIDMDGETYELLYEEYQTVKQGVLDGTIPQDVNNTMYMRWVHYERLVTYGENSYKIFASVDENGGYDKFVGLFPDEGDENNAPRNASYSLKQPYMSTGGYDIGGRSDVSNRTNRLQDLAVAYMLTRDVKYLECAYEVAIALGNWEHWGPGHFLNCADGSQAFARYFDWTYNGYVELAAQGVTRIDGTAYDVKHLAEILFYQGVHEGYISTIGETTEHLSEPVGAHGAIYNDRTNNWNAVCTAGMAIAALAVMGEKDEFYHESTYTLTENLKTLVELGLDIYAPDGAYIEGPGYWNYGTNNFFYLCSALQSAAGTTYGMMDTWGMDKTCYFASHSESSDGRTFNFADGQEQQQACQMFFYVASIFNDATLYDVRLSQIDGNLKNANIFDLIYYPRDIEIEASAVEFDYYTSSIELFTTRNGWTPGSLYAGMIGGDNQSSHGQIEGGSFIYCNGGTQWISDLGTENYNCEGFWPDSTRYRFYVMKPEGNNTLALSSDPTGIPYGQHLVDGGLYALEGADGRYQGSNEYGAYVVYDGTSALEGYASTWYRAMMLTNDRKTTIIQDQVTFHEMQQIHWFAHYKTGRVDEVKISKDGKTAYLIDEYTGEFGQKAHKAVRLSIVSARKDLKFEIMDCYTFVHTEGEKATYTQGFVETLGNGIPENDRSDYNKLVIHSGNTLDFNLAVVIEMIDYNTIETQDEIAVGYEYTDVREWVPTEDMRNKEDIVEDGIPRRDTPNIKTDIVAGVQRIKGYETNGTMFTEDLDNFYKIATDFYYAAITLGNDLPSSYISYRTEGLEYIDKYSAMRNEVVELQKPQEKFAQYLLGIKSLSAE